MRLYSLLLFRFYCWVEIVTSPKHPSSNEGILFRGSFVLHICLWLGMTVPLGVVRLLSQAQLDPTTIMGFTFYLVPIASYIVYYNGNGMKIIRKMRKQLNENQEEERRKAKNVAISCLIGTVLCFGVVVVANTNFNKQQHIDQLKLTPEHQEQQQRFYEDSVEYETRLKQRYEREFRKFQQNRDSVK